MSALFPTLPSPILGLAARDIPQRTWQPIPATPSEFPPVQRNPWSPLPAWPAPAANPFSSEPIRSPLSFLPPFPPSPAIVQPTSPAPIAAPATVTAAPATFTAQESPVARDFTDEDLKQAFAPIVEEAVRKAVYAKENGMDTYLEPMLRATIRRALAEFSPAARPFKEPRTFDRWIWHLQALFTSRTYEDILFEKTRRFQVEEVFLVDSASLALVSFASSDPARHASAKRVAATAQNIALKLKDDSGNLRESIELPDSRLAISRPGKFVHLTAVVRGTPSELVFADLEFALRRIEDRFRDQFKQDGSPLLFALQPFLEDCLLIQSPSSNQ